MIPYSVHMKFLTYCLYSIQQELGEAAALAQRKYYEKYPDPKAWTLESVDEWVSTAVKKVGIHLLGELRKNLPVADPKQTPAFLEQIKLHYEKFDDQPEMQQEKLWMLATSAMAPVMKVKWLQRWNSSSSIRVAHKFPKEAFPDLIFPAWLHKATWWAQV